MLNPFETVEDIVVTQFNEEALIKFRSQVMRKAMIDPVQPIVIYISSYGGSADTLAGMMAVLEQIPNKVVTVAIGKAMSCGAILLAAGDFRFCDKNARVMIHEVQGFVGGDVHKIEENSAETSRLNKYWLGELAKNCGLKNYAELREIIKKRDSNELWFDAVQAKKFGIVDFVGLPAIKPFVLFDIGCVSYGRSPQEAMINPEELLKQTQSKKKTSKKILKKVSKKIKKTSKKVKKKVEQIPIDPLEAMRKMFPSMLVEESNQ